MRPTLPLAPILGLALIASCIGDRVPTNAELGQPPKPAFDHIGGVAPTIAVDANNYVLHLHADQIGVDRQGGGSSYKGTQALFGGELSYGNAPDAAFFHNTLGLRTTSRLQGTVLPIQVAAPPRFADHQTVSLLIEKTAGASRPLGLIVVRETLAFHDAPDDDYVILKYTLYNPRATAVDNLHVGQILDTDLGDVGDDVVEYDPVSDLVRVSSTSEATPVAGHAILRLPTTSYHPYNQASFPGGFTDPSTTTEWFDFLAGGIVNPGPYGPGDIRHALSHGPVTIRGGEGEVFAFVLAGGDDADDLAANVAAARARYRGLPRDALRPHPVIAVRVTIDPWPIDPAIHSEFTAVLRGIPRKLVPLFDGDQTFCGVPPLVASHATTLVQLRDGIRATFPIANLPPTGLGPGDEIVCAGRLTDGTVFVGRPAPTPLPVAPATQLTAIGVNHAPTWSPDGSAIAFASDRSGEFAIWRMTLIGGEASAVQVTTGPVDRSPDWFGSTIAFRRGGEIYSVPEAGGAITLINADGANPRFSPDGSTIAFTRDSHVWTMAAGGGGESQVTSGTFELHPEWSSDGSEIYFTDLGAPRGAIFKIAAAGGNPERVTPEEGTDNRHPAVSPDGRVLAFVSRAELVLQDLTTGHHTVVPLDPRVSDITLTGADRFQNVEFSPDGTKLLFVAGGHVWLADLSAILP